MRPGAWYHGHGAPFVLVLYSFYSIYRKNRTMDTGTGETSDSDMETTKKDYLLIRHNVELRKILRDLLSLDPDRIDAEVLREIHKTARETLARQDRRSTGAGFANPQVRAQARAILDARSEALYREVAPILRRLRAEGKSFELIARHLNAKGIKAPAGGEWARGSVKHVYDRLPPE